MLTSEILKPRLPREVENPPYTHVLLFGDIFVDVPLIFLTQLK